LWRRAIGVVGVLTVSACSGAPSGSGGLGAVSAGFSETIVEGALALLVLVGCGLFFWNRRR